MLRVIDGAFQRGEAIRLDDGSVGVLRYRKDEAFGRLRCWRPVMVGVSVGCAVAMIMGRFRGG